MAMALEDLKQKMIEVGYPVTEMREYAPGRFHAVLSHRTGLTDATLARRLHPLGYQCVMFGWDHREGFYMRVVEMSEELTEC